MPSLTGSRLSPGGAVIAAATASAALVPVQPAFTGAERLAHGVPGLLRAPVPPEAARSPRAAGTTAHSYPVAATRMCARSAQSGCAAAALPWWVRWPGSPSRTASSASRKRSSVGFSHSRTRGQQGPRASAQSPARRPLVMQPARHRQHGRIGLSAIVLPASGQGRMPDRSSPAEAPCSCSRRQGRSRGSETRQLSHWSSSVSAYRYSSLASSSTSSALMRSLTSLNHRVCARLATSRAWPHRPQRTRCLEPDHLNPTTSPSS